MNIECVIVCDGYDDFLRETLPRNMAHFDHVVVVTGFDDSATIELCRELSVECIPTDVMHKGDGVENFSKGRAVDLGMSFLRRDDWIVQLDADMYLPPLTRRWIEWANPDADCIYGIDRFLCVGWEKWQQYLSQEARMLLQHRWHCLVEPPLNMPLGGRISLKDHEGYVPIGFFQLFNGRHGRRYPRRQADSAEHTDVLHSLQWPTNKRRLLPELFGIHLESELAPLGANWKGRKTKRFGAEGVRDGGGSSLTRAYCR